MNIRRVEAQPVSSRDFKDAAEVSHMFRHQFTLYYHVIYVDFNFLPICSSNILVIILW